MSHVHFTSSVVLAILRREYEEKIERSSAALNELYLERQQLHAEELQWARRHLLLVEKGVAIDAFHRGFVSQAVQEKLVADVDALLLDLESGKTDGSAEHGGEGSVYFRAQGLSNGRHFGQEIIVLYIRCRRWISRPVAVK